MTNNLTYKFITQTFNMTLMLMMIVSYLKYISSRLGYCLSIYTFYIRLLFRKESVSPHNNIHTHRHKHNRWLCKSFYPLNFNSVKSMGSAHAMYNTLYIAYFFFLIKTNSGTYTSLVIFMSADPFLYVPFLSSYSL